LIAQEASILRRVETGSGKFGRELERPVME
jgi:hypothetical protein